ncbi:MAG: (2Fe-2S)-binding protein [Bryobacteraceae bacterium]|nr:(2Fe-2S)-binding protein [Bryobacteraceae bacterium]
MSFEQDPDVQKKGFSRRGLLKGIGVTSGVGLLEKGAEAQTTANVQGPGEVPITLNLNGKPVKVAVEPRTTLLDALRDKLDMTGAKRVCDRGTCGACTVIVDGKAMYACTMLAIDAQGRKIRTIESLAAGANPHPMVKAFVNHDAQQCGYCTPGFVMAATNFVERSATASLTEDQVKDGLGGNLCRCGTYMGIRKAVVEAAKEMKGARNA